MKRFATTLTSRNKLLIFARIPEKGKIKTRLAESMGEDATLELYRAMLADLLDGLGPSDDCLDIEIVWTGGDGVDGEEIRNLFPGYRLSRQAGRSLGERLVVSFSEKIAFHEASRVIAIGTDLPTLDRGSVEIASRLLDSCDWVLGPSADGGYYLIGCRAGSFHPLVFEEIEWGSAGVVEATISRIRSLGTSVALLPERFDLDTEEDLRRYARLPGIERTRLGRLLAETK